MPNSPFHTQLAAYFQHKGLSKTHDTLECSSHNIATERNSPLVLLLATVYLLQAAEPQSRGKLLSASGCRGNSGIGHHA